MKLKKILNGIFKKNKVKKGFSLIELMVTISIIGLLSVISVVTVSNVRTNARDTKRMGDMRQLAMALDLYALDNGVYPNCSGYSRDAGGAWYTCLAPALSTYISAVPQDPSSNSYGYYYSSQYDGRVGWLVFPLEKSTPNAGYASFGWYDGQYGSYIYTKRVGYY